MAWDCLQEMLITCDLFIGSNSVANSASIPLNYVPFDCFLSWYFLADDFLPLFSWNIFISCLRVSCFLHSRFRWLLLLFWLQIYVCGLEFCMEICPVSLLCHSCLLEVSFNFSYLIISDFKRVGIGESTILLSLYSSNICYFNCEHFRFLWNFCIRSFNITVRKLPVT